MPHATIFVNHNKSSCPTLLCCCWTPLLLVFVAGYATQHHFAHFATQYDTATKTWTATWSTELDRRYCAACRPLLHASVAPVLVATVKYHKICHGWGQVVPREQLCVDPHTTWWRNTSAGAALFTDQLQCPLTLSWEAYEVLDTTTEDYEYHL